MQREARNLRRILQVNIGLNFCYMLGGWQMAHRAPQGESGERRRGMALGIILQGLLLLCFDTYHAMRVPRYDQQQKG